MINTIESLKASYSETARANDKHYSLLAHPMRFVSFWLTVPFLRLKWSANQVTLLRLATTLVMVICLASGGRWAVVVGSALCALQWLLDSVDGNIARFQKQSSDRGYFLDVMADWSSRALIPIGLAAGLFLHPDQPFVSIAAYVDPHLLLFLGVTVFTFLESLLYLLSWRLQAMQYAAELAFVQARAKRLRANLLNDMNPTKADAPVFLNRTRRTQLREQMTRFDYGLRSAYEILIFTFFLFALVHGAGYFLLLLWLHQTLVCISGILFMFLFEL